MAHFHERRRIRIRTRIQIPVLCTVADPGFSRGGAPTPKSAFIFQYFCRKLHENERIWTPGGASLAPP